MGPEGGQFENLTTLHADGQNWSVPTVASAAAKAHGSVGARFVLTGGTSIVAGNKVLIREIGVCKSDTRHTVLEGKTSYIQISVNQVY